METIHVFQVTCQQTQVSHVSDTWGLWNSRGCERRHRRVDNEGTNYGWEEGKTFTNIRVRRLLNQNPKYVKYEGERGAAHTMDYGRWRFRRTIGSSSPLKYRQWLNIHYKTRLGVVRGAELTQVPEDCMKRWWSWTVPVGIDAHQTSNREQVSIHFSISNYLQ